MSIADQLDERRNKLIADASAIAQKGVTEGRDLSHEEQTAFEGMFAEAQALEGRADAIREGEARAKSIEDHMGGRRETAQDSGLGAWARSARLGDYFDVAAVPGAENRAVAARRGGVEARAMSASGGVAQDGVYGQLWQYAVAGSQLLQSGVDIIHTTDGNTLPMPKATVHASTGDTTVAASASLTSSDSTITTVNLSVSKYGYITLVPSELVQDTTFDLEGYISQNAGRDLGRTVGSISAAAAISGFTTAGVTAPTGVTTTLGNQTTVGQGTDLLFQLFHSVLPEYRSGNAAWLMNDSSAALVRQLKGSTGQSVWESALTAGDPSLIEGKPVYIVPQLDSFGVTKKPIFFGEMQALKVRIAGGIRFERSDQFAFDKDQVAFRAIVRCGAVAVDPNAVKPLVTAAS